MALIECGPWRPDQPDLGAPGVTLAKDCLPSPRGFRPLLQKAIVSDALTASPLGAVSSTSPASVVRVFAGDTTKLYSLAAATWSDVSKAGGYTNTATFWDFAVFSGVMIATNFADSPQSYTMDVSTLFADLTTDFKARYVAVVRTFVMFGNIWDSVDGNTPYRIRWSAANDETDYTVSATTQSDFRDIPTGGNVQRIFGGEYGIIFMERTILRATYAGPPVQFQIDEIAPNIGLYAPGAAAQDGDVIFFLDNSGFYAITGGQNVSPIGNEKVDAWFFQDLDGTQKDSISCAVDRENKVVVWAYPGVGNLSGKANKMVIFDYQLGEWSYAEIDTDLIFSSLTVGFTLETLDSLSTDMDTINISMDSRILYPKNKALGIFDSFKLHHFAGTPLTATIETKELQPTQGKRTVVTQARPIVDGGTTTIAIGTRNRQQDDVVWSDSADVNDVGFAPLRSEGRYLRARMQMSGAWTEVQGVEIGGGTSGGR